MAWVAHPHVVVIDEVGYLAYGDDTASLIFHIVNERHLKHRAMVFTANPPKDWGRVLHDDDLAAAIVERLLERGRHLVLDGPSIRPKHLGLEDPIEPNFRNEIGGVFRSPQPLFSGVAECNAVPAETPARPPPPWVRDPPVTPRPTAPPGELRVSR